MKIHHIVRRAGLKHKVVAVHPNGDEREVARAGTHWYRRSAENVAAALDAAFEDGALYAREQSDKMLAHLHRRLETARTAPRDEPVIPARRRGDFLDPPRPSKARGPSAPYRIEHPARHAHDDSTHMTALAAHHLAHYPPSPWEPSRGSTSSDNSASCGDSGY